MGGLGNQMFQYALARKIELSKKVTVKLDISWFNNFDKKTTPRYYSLPKFNIIESIATEQEIKKFQKYKKIPGRRHFLHNFFIANNSIYIEEKKASFNNILQNVKDNTYLYGNWQTEKYFKDIQGTIRKELSLKEEPSNNYKKNLESIKQKRKSSVSIHIRRGDYTLPEIEDRIGICSLDYYVRSIKKINDIIPNPHFFIFTDDVEWVKNNLKLNYPATFVSSQENTNHSNKDYEELLLMSKCSHNIIANSTFSWWGAWLNINPDKIVIAPKKWYKKPMKNSENKSLDSWVEL